MLVGTEQRIYNTPELLAVARAARTFRQIHRSVTSRDFASEWAVRLGRVADNSPNSERRFNRLAPLAGFAASAAVIPPLDNLLAIQQQARDAGHSKRWIRKALKHPESRP